MADEVILPSDFYSEKKNDRKQYEDRAKLIAKLTLPYVIREESDTGTTSMTDSSNQSYGGRLINTLKAKMGMALLPPTASSFKYVPKPEELAALTGGNKNNIAKVYQVMSNNYLIINCTPLGTFPNIHEYPDIPYEYLTKDHLAFDLTYNPRETQFMIRSKKNGARVTNGLKMLEYQAKRSLSIWDS